MMKIWYIFLKLLGGVLVAVSLLCGGYLGFRYLDLPKNLPEDFMVEFIAGPVYMEMGPQRFIKIEHEIAEGNEQFILVWGENWPVLNNERQHRPLAKETVTAFLSREDCLSVYREIEWQRFWCLSKNFSSEDSLDGGYYSLSVQAEGRKHTVHITNTDIKRAVAIATRLEALVTERE